VFALPYTTNTSGTSTTRTAGPRVRAHAAHPEHSR
jgi:hypothetical protein